MPTPLNWITDRLPTKADADEDGDVIGLLPGGLSWYGMYWSEIEPGQAWLPFKPPSTDSAPAPLTPALTTSQPRPIVSITESEGTVLAVADDGTAWRLSTDRSLWFQLPALPDRG